MALYHLNENVELAAPVLVAAFDGWVDAGSAATTAAEQLAEAGDVLATFRDDSLYDYRARRPTLEIVDGRPAELSWPELVLHRSSIGGRDVLVLTGPEPDYRWRELANDAAELATRLGVTEWVTLGAIPAAVPHTRPVPVLGTESQPGLLRGSIQPGPAGTLRVPAAATSVLDHAVSIAGIPAVGYYAQVPHYLNGAYPAAALALLHAVAPHVGGDVPPGRLPAEALQLRARLDAAAASDDSTRSYVERLEAMVDEARLPSGDELIGEIERFLRDRGTPGGSGRLN